MGDFRVLNKRKPLFFIMNVVIDFSWIFVLVVAPNVLVVENKINCFEGKPWFQGFKFLWELMCIHSACLALFKKIFLV